jgi:vacuolar-type H+-ATPase subunit D/Vma8
MEQQQKQMARAVQQLEERKRAQNINPDDKLAMFRQQATLVAKKREAIAQRLATVGRERAGIEAEMEAVMRRTQLSLEHHGVPKAVVDAALQEELAHGARLLKALSGVKVVLDSACAFVLNR